MKTRMGMAHGAWRMAAAAVLVAAMALSQGCASYAVMKMDESQVRQETALRMMRNGDGLAVAIDLMAITPAYMRTWGNHPVMFGTAHVVDGLASYFLGMELKAALSDDGSTGSSQAMPTMTVNTQGGDAIIVNNGGTVSSERTWTTTSGK